MKSLSQADRNKYALEEARSAKATVLGSVGTHVGNQFVSPALVAYVSGRSIAALAHAMVGAHTRDVQTMVYAATRDRSGDAEDDGRTIGEIYDAAHPLDPDQARDMEHARALRMIAMANLSAELG